MAPLAVTLLALAIAVTVVAAVVALRRERELRPHRAWWQIPAVWMGAGVVVTLVGVFVLPRLFGFAFLFLPFVWLGGFRRRRGDPRGADPRDV
jgi:multisubunit Na+/H+ antiporter MnhB subunit